VLVRGRVHYVTTTAAETTAAVVAGSWRGGDRRAVSVGHFSVVV